ncbi:MAG: hypothetical protein ACTSRP_12420 [Candidatus Helarchaeota archaeon]
MVKVKVYRFVGDWGDGLIFVDVNTEKGDYYEQDSDFENLGIFDLPQDFLNAIGYQNKIASCWYAE